MSRTEKLVYFSSADPTAVSGRNVFHEKLIALRAAWVLLRRKTQRSEKVTANLWQEESLHVQMIRK